MLTYSRDNEKELEVRITGIQLQSTVDNFFIYAALRLISNIYIAERHWLNIERLRSIHAHIDWRELVNCEKIPIAYTSLFIYILSDITMTLLRWSIDSSEITILTRIC